MPVSKMPGAAYAAKRAAERFIEAWDTYHARWLREPEPRSVVGGVAGACKERAALRRASLDLTRALAEIRKPGGV